MTSLIGKPPLPPCHLKSSFPEPPLPPHCAQAIQNKYAGFGDFKYPKYSERNSICLHLLLFNLENSVLMSEIPARGLCSQSKFDTEMTT